MNAQSIGKLLYVGPNSAKVLHHRADAIAFLDPELRGTPDLELYTSASRNTGK